MTRRTCSESNFLRPPAQWLSSPTNFLFPESAASIIYRAKFRDAMIAAGLYDSIDSRVWQQHWPVDVLPVADGRAALKYLAPYVFRVAISDNRIEHVTDTHVTRQAWQQNLRRTAQTSRGAFGGFRQLWDQSSVS